MSSLPRNGASLSRRSTAHGAAHSVHPDPSSPQARRYFAAEKYVSVSQVLVYIGTLRSQGRDQRIPMLARVSIADYRGRILLDTLVGPTHPVEDYRTEETGYTSSTFTNGRISRIWQVGLTIRLPQAPTFQDTQRRVASIIRTKILVGHCLWKFLSVLGLSHPASDTRDLALFLPLREGLRRQYIVDLPTLIQEVMGRSLGMQYEDSVESARAAIDLFRCCENVFDSRINAGEWPCDLPPLTYAEYFT